MGQQTTSLARIRGRLHETSAGYYSDATLYTYLDAGQTAVIDFLIMKTRFMQERDKYWQSKSLVPIIATNTFDTASGTAEYAQLGTGFRETVGAKVKYNTPATPTKCAYVSSDHALWKATNTYASASVTNALYYISGSNIGFIPTPDATVVSGATHYYYKTPTTVDSTHDFTLLSEVWLAIENYALYLALQEDGRSAEAQQCLQDFLTQLGDK